jgi:peroxiredoxin
MCGWLVFAACGGAGQQPIGPTFGAVLRASNEVIAPITTSGTGNASFIVRGKAVTYGITSIELSGAGSGELHLGAPHTDGPVVVRNLFVQDATTPRSRARNGFGQSDILATAPGAASMTIDELVAQMRAGNVYVNVVTDENPAGEIRGQLALTAEAPGISSRLWSGPMGRSDPLLMLPKDLPFPQDDGACAHLLNMMVPPIALPSTAGRDVVLAGESHERRIVVYAYPRTGEPDRDPPPEWNSIPGARGCTPQTCAFRNAHAELRALGATVYGLSTQTTAYQREMAERLRLPFEVLSDAELRFTRALRLPTFEFAGMTLLKRATLVVYRGEVEKVFYPVFPPDQSPRPVLEWLRDVDRGSFVP